MKELKKLFKHGGSLAMVIPKEFAKKLESNEVTIEIKEDKDNNPILVIRPITSTLDTIENDPLFHKFIDLVYKDAMLHPEKLYTTEQIFDEKFLKLMEGVEVEDE